MAITPYFLEKGNLWFAQNLHKLIRARDTQPFFQEHTEFVRVGAKTELFWLLRRLDELGYEKVFEVREPGEFAHRGGFVELFPISLPYAIRIEFLGNTPESIEELPIRVENEQKSKDILKKRLKSQKLFSDLKNLKEGEYLVHLGHGVGRYAGSERIGDRSYYILEYASQDRLFIPHGLERKLSRYVGFTEPRVSRLSSPVWFKTKRKVREEVEKLARELLELYAKRETGTRKPYAIDHGLEGSLRETFPYQETPDQLQALQEIREDLQKEKPMDRLVCGDVGFGKTEIALRTMAYAVENGYQAALLAPTTLLAHQHFQNFRERLSRTPIQVALLSRLQKSREQQEILKKAALGTIDIIIGTHRLLSKDVRFQNLGLLVIDDEQRFGVKQKEKLRELRASLDVLSLSATPIPRTLYMALSSLKNVSIIQTPPEGRQAVDVRVAKRSERAIAQFLREELEKKHQIYYLHNRIGTIQHEKDWLLSLAPNARIGIVHARISERQLIQIIEDFRNKKYDILLATTIIENGLDLPDVNALLVDNATKLGLAQAYQIRGRIGRSHAKAKALFLYAPQELTEQAKLRLDALQEATEPGAGYRIALRDLEIRGAGNILGKEQSGSINTVGLNLYCQMLSEAVEKLRS
ncbi:MAG: CarD family transcriptional regulator [Candidatus Yanofskybacteria bacterium]|nr:CarD family transcriptional regulator [Candidatus Yanofskybacteria bacterium]